MKSVLLKKIEKKETAEDMTELKKLKPQEENALLFDGYLKRRNSQKRKI